MSINKLLINCANAPQSIHFFLSMSVVINCICPKTGDGNGAEHLFTQLAALARVPSFVYLYLLSLEQVLGTPGKISSC
jgi:hypothetical protein